MKTEGKILAEQIEKMSQLIQLPEIESLMENKLSIYPGDRQTKIEELLIDLFANFN